MTGPMTAQDMHERDLAELKIQFCDAGWWPALFGAVKYCQTVSIPLPEWAALAVLNLIQDRHFEDGKAGGYGSARGKFNMDYAHRLRWEAVDLALRLNGMQTLPLHSRRGRPKPEGTSPSKTAILAQAKEHLSKKPLGRPRSLEQIEESYRMVEKSLNAGEARFRFDANFVL